MLPFTAANDQPPRASTELDSQLRDTLPPPTIPMPRSSEVRIKVARLNEIVDLVTADLQLDPRSEDFIGGPEQVPAPSARMCVFPKRLGSLPAPSRAMPHAPLASDTYFTRPMSGVADARHLPFEPEYDEAPMAPAPPAKSKRRATRAKKSA
jgi:hypothetical protein